jgi:catechol 2,3-dioxygenase-like lactoylglutathione lyase family enzyme
MNRKIALITILTNNVPVLRDFYQEVLGFEISDDMGITKSLPHRI